MHLIHLQENVFQMVYLGSTRIMPFTPDAEVMLNDVHGLRAGPPDRFFRPMRQSG